MYALAILQLAVIYTGRIPTEFDFILNGEVTKQEAFLFGKSAQYYYLLLARNVIIFIIKSSEVSVANS